MNEKNLIDEAGKRYGRLVVLGRSSRVVVETRKGKGRVRARDWVCQCDCGQQCDVRRYKLRSGQKVSCGKGQCATGQPGRRKHESAGDIPWDWWMRLHEKARARKLEVTVTLPQLWDLFLQQNRACALSGVPLSFAGHVKSEHTASLDRIDSTKPYSLDNVQWIYKPLNLMKRTMADAEFIRLCTLVADYAKKKLPKS